MFEYILYYLLTCGFVMTYFIQVNEEILYDNYVKFEKERGTKPTRGWFKFYIFVHYLKSPFLTPLIYAPCCALVDMPNKALYLLLKYAILSCSQLYLTVVFCIFVCNAIGLSVVAIVNYLLIIKC